MATKCPRGVTLCEFALRKCCRGCTVTSADKMLHIGTHRIIKTIPLSVVQRLFLMKSARLSLSVFHHPRFVVIRPGDCRDYFWLFTRREEKKGKRKWCSHWDFANYGLQVLQLLRNIHEEASNVPYCAHKMLMLCFMVAVNEMERGVSELALPLCPAARWPPPPPPKIALVRWEAVKVTFTFAVNNKLPEFVIFASL